MYRTKKLNVYEEQHKWETWHRAQRSTLALDPESGRVMQAIYDSPLKRWGYCLGPDGYVYVPDMDYYNTLKSEEDITKAIEDIFGF